MIMKSIEKLRIIDKYPEAVAFFATLFEKAGIRVVDTGEEIGCLHMGKHIEFVEGLDPENIDYILDLKSDQIDILVDLVVSGGIDDNKRYNILTTLFAPAIDSSINPFECLKGITRPTSFLSNTLLRRLLKMEDLIHVYIKHPDSGGSEVGNTLVFARKEWLVFSGLHGNPGRVFRLTIDDALEFHKQALTALKADSRFSWLKFARWYLSWRKRVS